MTARDVPGFPEDDPKLMVLKNWPKKRRIGGWDCELNIVNACITGAPSTMTTSACYRCRPRWWPWAIPQMRGPHYTWTSDGRLLERANAGLVYAVDRAGRLAMFEDRKHRSYEYFDTDGVLIGGEYAPVGLDWRAEGYRGGTVSVWLGDRVTHDEFIRRVRELNRSRY